MANAIHRSAAMRTPFGHAPAVMRRPAGGCNAGLRLGLQSARNRATAEWGARARHGNDARCCAATARAGPAGGGGRGAGRPGDLCGGRARGSPFSRRSPAPAVSRCCAWRSPSGPTPARSSSSTRRPSRSLRFDRNDGLGFWQLPGPWVDVFRFNLPSAAIALIVYVGASVMALIGGVRGLRLDRGAEPDRGSLPVQPPRDRRGRLAHGRDRRLRDRPCGSAVSRLRSRSGARSRCGSSARRC